MANSQTPQAKQAANEYRGLGKGYQGAAIRWRDYASSSANAGDPQYNEIIMSCGFRLFIMGVEVTPHVMSSISVDRHGRDGINSLSFTLDNNFSKFVYTNWNLGGDISKDNGYYGNIVKTVAEKTMNNMVPSLDAKVSSETTPETMPKAEKLNWYLPEYTGKDKYVFDEVPKRDLYDYKSKLGIKAKSTGNKYKSRYDLTPGACAINILDHVRYFIMDPNEDNLVLEDTMWKPEYTGFITSAAVSENPMTGESSIQVTCHDIRHVMRKMRYMTNANDASVLSTLITFDDLGEVQDGTGLFNDLFMASKVTKFANTLSDCSAETVIRAMILGEDIDALKVDANATDRIWKLETSQDAKYPKSPTFTSINALDSWYSNKIKEVMAEKSKPGSNFSPIGTFTMGLFKGYTPPEGTKNTDNSEQVAKLEEWMDTLNFGIARQWLSYNDVTIIGQNTRPSLGKEFGAKDDQSPFSAHNGFLHVLCPAGGLSVENIWDKVFVTLDGSPSMSNRMEVLEQMCNTIDYQIHVNTMGDLMFEFPMYDFYPEEFGKYKYTMALGDSIKSHEFNDEGDGNPVTGLRVFGNYSADDMYSKEDNEWLRANLYSVYIKSDYMASKYGVLVEELSIPWATGAWGTATTGEGSENAEKITALASFGVIEFTKRVAKMSHMGINSIYNPFLWPNKPILNKELRRMGLITGINSAMQLNGVCTTGINSEYIRKADTNGEFLNLCGAKNTPFSYANKNGLALFPRKGMDLNKTEMPFQQNGSVVYTINNGFGIEIIQPDEASIQALQQKFNLQGNSSSVDPAHAPVSKREYSDPQKCYNRFRQLPQAEQDKMNAMANKLCGGDGSLRGWQIYQYMLSESGYNPKQPNIGGGATGATGLIQFMPSTLISMANAGKLPGAPKGLNPDKPADRLTMNNWFRSSPYCTSPNATLLQLDMTADYFAMNAPKGIKTGVVGLNQVVFLPAANSDPNMSFSDPRQQSKWVKKNAAQISKQNGGVDTLGGLLRAKGISTATPPSDAQLEQNRLAGVKGSNAAVTPTTAAQQAPVKLKSTDSTGSTYVAGKAISTKKTDLSNVIQAKATKSSQSGDVLGNIIGSVASSVMTPMTDGITKGVTGYTGNVITDAGMKSALDSVSATAGSTLPGAVQGTLEQVDSNASQVKIGGFYKPMADGLGLVRRPGVQTGN